MVVGALIAYYAPSNRGFVRASSDVPLESLHNFESEWEACGDHERAVSSSSASCRKGNRTSATKLRRIPLRAMAVLTSIASDIDIIADWCFFLQSFREDRQYRSAYKENPVDGELSYLIPRRLLIAVFVSCVLGTIMYLIIVTEGRIVAPLTRRMGVDKISMGFILFLAVLVEDIPQVVLTFLVEDYFEQGKSLSQMAVLNLTSSLYDTCIKIAESYDQRHDVVETGIWLKRSITGHKATITDILILPDDIIIPPVPPSKPASATKQGRSQSVTVSTAAASRQGSASISRMGSMLDLSSLSLPTLPMPSFRRSSQKPFLLDAFLPEEEPMTPQAYFLTASLDKTIKLWSISSPNEDDSQSYEPSMSTKEKCIRKYRDFESGGFTCLAWVGKQSNQEKQPKQSFFLAGCNNGCAKLWDLAGYCHGTYQLESATRSTKSNNRVASITAITIDGRHLFVCGHESGEIRLWNTWGMFCQGQLKAHDKRVSSVTFLGEGVQFVSASTDSTLKLWDIRKLLRQQKPETGIEVEIDPHDGRRSIQTGLRDANTSRSKGVPPDVSVSNDMPTKEFIGHRAAVLSVVCVDPKSAILSGSQDGTARLWSLESGLCLRVFRGHSNGVHSVLAIDRVTFLTGSSDNTIRAWDALSGESLRVYEGHKSTVTALGTTKVRQDQKEGSTSFVSTSADRTIKWWVLTAVSYRDPATTFDHILEFQDDACRCFDPAMCGQHSRRSPNNAYREYDFEHPYYDSYLEEPT